MDKTPIGTTVLTCQGKGVIACYDTTPKLLRTRYGLTLDKNPFSYPGPHYYYDDEFVVVYQEDKE